MPNSDEPVRHKEHQDIRRLLMGRERYYLYYRSHPQEKRVDVVALWHTSR